MGDYNYILKMIEIKTDVVTTKAEVEMGSSLVTLGHQQFNWISFNRNR